MNESTSYNILCSTDDNYAAYCGIMLTSLLENNSKHFWDIYILTDGISETNTKKFNELSKIYKCSLHIIYVKEEDFKDCPIREGDHVTLATYYRIIAPKVLPQDINLILYLDCDMIINGDISQLWNYSYNSVGIGAVIDEAFFADRTERLGLCPKDNYVSAGMLMMNLDYWRENSVMEQCFKYISNNTDRLLFHDQDTINVILKEQKLLLPLAYNFQTGFILQCYIGKYRDCGLYEEIVATQSTPVVIHYTGPNKPWINHSYHPFVPLYDYYLELSLWKGLQKKKVKESIKPRILRYFWDIGLIARPKTYSIGVVTKEKI